MPRRNRNAGGQDFESMSPARVRALQEQLAHEWRVRMGKWSQRPADRERW